MEVKFTYKEDLINLIKIYDLTENYTGIFPKLI